MNQPFKIGVVSDTHIPTKTRSLPKALLRGLEGVDMILHAGDLVQTQVIKELSKLAPVHAVCGNMDPPEVRSELTPTLLLEAAGRTIAMTHGSGSPHGLADRVEQTFIRAGIAKPDIVVFGHSHEPTVDWRDDVLRFNPGSPTDKRFTAHGTYGILTLGETVEGAIVELP